MQPQKIQERDQFLERPLPSNTESERAILGAILIDNAVLPQAIEHLQPDYFYSPFHRAVFAAMLELFNRREKVDPILIGEELKKEGKLESYGGVAAVANLTYGLPHFSSIFHYVKLVKEKNQIRDLIQACNVIVSTALAEDDLPENVLQQGQSLINLVCTQEDKKGFIGINKLSEQAVQRVAELKERGVTHTGLRTGFRDWDLMTGGLQKTDLIIVAGRPAQGKSSLVANIAEKTCALEPWAAVAIFSLEMSCEQYTDRLLCSMAEVDLTRYRTGFLTQTEFEKILAARNELQDYDISIDDTSGLSPLEMRSKLMRLRAERRRLDLVVVDYLQRMSASGRTESRQQEVSSIARELKSIAKDFEVPVVAVSSLSRECEKRNPPRPRMSDLRESGDIESEADLVAFIYRPEYYNQTDENVGFAELIIDKHRHGPTGTVKLAFMKEYTKFANYANYYGD